MIVVATQLWDANEKSYAFSRMYDETWVEKLFRGFARNLSHPFRFVCFTERERKFAHADIEQERLSTDKPSWANCIEPFRLNEPMIQVGLDTIITGNIDHLADWCLHGQVVALPLDPNAKPKACNGVVLAPAGQRRIYDRWNGENDMDWMNRQPHVLIDDLWPGHVVSYKGHVRQHGLGDARIVYFHGDLKPHQLSDVPWVAEHWR